MVQRERDSRIVRGDGFWPKPSYRSSFAKRYSWAKLSNLEASSAPLASEQGSRTRRTPRVVLHLSPVRVARRLGLSRRCRSGGRRRRHRRRRAGTLVHPGIPREPLRSGRMGREHAAQHARRGLRGLLRGDPGRRPAGQARSNFRPPRSSSPGPTTRPHRSKGPSSSGTRSPTHVSWSSSRRRTWPTSSSQMRSRGRYWNT
jgi:hypothetical protein